MQNKDLTLFATGYVVEDKVEDEKTILAYPISTIPTASGDLSRDEVLTAAVKDISDNNISVIANKSNSIECQWLNQGNSNRLSAPDVGRGEIVFIYNFHGQDQFYWDTVFVKPEYRKMEKVFYFFSAKAAIDLTAEYLKKGYFFLVDTYNKKTHFHTSDTNGEFTTYDVSIDGKKGSLLVIDGRGNGIEIVSHKDGLVINTNAFVTVNTKKAEINATDSCQIVTKQCTIISEKCDINP